MAIKYGRDYIKNIGAYNGFKDEILFNYTADEINDLL